MIILYIALGLLMFCLLASLLCYYIVFYSPKKGQNDIYSLPEGEQYAPYRDAMLAEIREAAALRSEAVAIQSRDGLRLCARYYGRYTAAPVAICFHGYRATGLRDFSGGVQALLKLGLNVLLIDERAQGESAGHTITFGVKERYDCLDWIAYISDRFGPQTPVLLYGISMGAATVLMATGLALPENVRGIVADCPYDTPKNIICKVCRDLHLPDKLLYPLIALGARLFGGFRLSDGDAAAAVKHTPVPILLLHGEDDRFVPCAMSRAIQQANPSRIALHTFPQAGHGISYLVDKPRYLFLVSRFIRDLPVRQGDTAGTRFPRT